MTPDAAMALMQRFADAWNAHDADEILACMTRDCVYLAAAGADPAGNSFKGREEVRAACEEVWTITPDAQWDVTGHYVVGDRGYTTWRFSGSSVAGDFKEMNGLDLFVFEGDRIAIKDTYRKAVVKS